MDVVYNHTAEGGHTGPTLCYRGIDNASYYRLDPDEPRFYIDDTGCGNTLNTGHSRVLQLVMDSLRYWVDEMHVDGFRFDLASALGREAHGFDPASGFFDAVRQDPVLASVKLIAEPWDIGPGGYQLGHFPPGWSEWNDQYRDTMRRFWRGEAGLMPEFARRLHGSSDVFEHSQRGLNDETEDEDGKASRLLLSPTRKHFVQLVGAIGVISENDQMDLWRDSVAIWTITRFSLQPHGLAEHPFWPRARDQGVREDLSDRGDPHYLDAGALHPRVQQ